MDFSLGEEQQAVQDLARQLFTGSATTERVQAVESTDDRIDADLWATLAETGLLGIALPADLGGAGLGMTELCVVLEEQGRQVAPVPVWSAVLAASAVAAHGSAGQRVAWVPGTADGSVRLTVALEEFGPGDPSSPTAAANPDGGGWRVHGTKAAVPSLPGAQRVIVSAMTEAGPALFLVDPGAAGVVTERVETTSREICGHLVLDGASAELLGKPGEGSVGWLVERAELALAALQLGVAGGALRHAASYLSERAQFGRPLATFQAVAHQLADCYIDVEAMRVTLWQATLLVSNGEPSGTAVLVAKWWATDAGQRVVHRVQHLHGGIGVDTDHPIHRYLLWGKQVAGTLGGSSSDLARMGALFAAGAEISA